MLHAAALLLLAGASTAQAAPDDWELSLDGYYRVRGQLMAGGLLGNPDVSFFEGQDEDARMMVQRLRLQPGISFEGRAKFFMMTDVLDDVVWGDNQSASSTALFAGDPTTTGVDGIADSTFKLKRAWIEFDLPVGLMRVGRQPSAWGMGLLANAGDGFDDTFGENHYGSTYDRVIFATKPIAIAQTIAGKEPADIPLYLAVGVDRLVEDPLIQYYGYECSTTWVNPESNQEEIIEEGDPVYNPACDPDGLGYHTIEHTNEDTTRLDTDRGGDWWADQDDDVWEMVYALLYRGEDVDMLGSKGDLTAGAYVVNRVQRETDSKVWIYDAYLRWLWKGIYLETEALTIQGTTRAIAPDAAVEGIDGDPLKKKANVWSYVARAGYKSDLISGVFETGYASGDENTLGDGDFTGRALHPDYNVGLLIYEEVLSRVTAGAWTDTARGLWSNGGVVNSRYIFPQVTWSPMDNWHVTGAWLMAWPDKPDGIIIYCSADDDVACDNPRATARSLGWEADLAIKHQFHEHLLFSLESGYARTTDRIAYQVGGLHSSTNADGAAIGRFFTLQSRIAYEF